MKTVVVLSICLMYIGCTGSSRDAQTDSSSAVAKSGSPDLAPTPPVTAGSPDPCPPTGLWAVCSVEKRLKQSGFVTQKNDSAFEPRAGLSVKPAVYTLNKSRLEVYIYPSAPALSREVAGMDTTTIAPVFIRSGNLAALLFTDDATQAERVSLALTAGAPQPTR